jgi:hypothetical protein
MLAAPQRLTVPVRRREKLRRALVLSLALHLAILLCCLIVLPTPSETPSPTPEGKGAPTSVAMVMDVGSSEGVKRPAPSYAPAIVAPGEAPSKAPPPPMPPSDPTEATAAPDAPAVPPPTAAPQAQSPPSTPTPTPAQSTAPMPAPATETAAATLPPPPSAPAPPQTVPTPALPSQAAVRAAPRPAPHTMTTNRLPAPPSHTMRQPNRTANNEGALNQSPGPQAVNSQGAPPHTTNGPDPTTSVDGAAGEDGQLPHLQRQRQRHLVERVTDKVCTGIYEFGPHSTGSHEAGPGAGEHFFSGMNVQAAAHFFRKPDGTPWVTFYLRSRGPADLPVTIMGSGIRWTGVYGVVYTVWPSGDNHLAGQSSPGGKIDLACEGGLPSL